MKKKVNEEKNIFIDRIINWLESKLERILKIKWIYYILLILIILAVNYINLKNNPNFLTNKNALNYFIIGCSISTVIAILLLFLNNKLRNKSIPFRFLIIGLILGTGYTFASPMFTQSDESFHFIRAYQIANGNLISPKDDFGNSYDSFPKSIYETLWDDDDIYPEFKNYEDSYKESKIKLEKNRTVAKNVRASNYIFLNYFSHAIGIKIGAVFNLSPYLIGLLGRLTNMIICLLLIYFSLKILPIGKKTMSVFLLAPSVLAYIASLSADGLIIAMSFLMISIIIKFMHDKTQFTWKWYVALLIIIAFVSTCKTTYLPMIGIVLFIPYQCFKSKKNKWISTLSLIILGVIFSISWITVGSVVISTSKYSGMYEYVRFLEIFINTLSKDFLSYIENIFAGNYLYQCQVNPYQIVPISYLILTVSSFLSEESDLNVRTIEKIFVSCIILVIVALISYALYMGNTDVTSNFINGIQGRYFAPIVLFIPFFIKNSKFKINDEILYDISIILNFALLVNMVEVFVI